MTDPVTPGRAAKLSAEDNQAFLNDARDTEAIREAAADRAAAAVIRAVADDLSRAHRVANPDDPQVPPEYSCLRRGAAALEARAEVGDPSRVAPPRQDNRLGFGCPERPELDELLRKSIAAFNALSPEEQKAHRELQMQSWVRGEMGIAAAERAEGGRRTVVPGQVERGS